MACATQSTPLSAATNAEIKTGAPVTLTEKAIKKLREFAAASPEAKGKGLRVSVQGGGCSGFQYGFAFDDQRPEDHVFATEDVTVIVDPNSFSYIHGSTVDFVDALTGAGFTITNPNAKSTCGCGTSFS